MKLKYFVAAVVLVFIPAFNKAAADLVMPAPQTASSTSSTPITEVPAPNFDQLKATDSDNDGLSDYDEIYVYHTDPHNPDTDGDGYPDGLEVANGYDPNVPTDHSDPPRDKIEKHIEVALKNQTLSYYLGPYLIKTILVSTGVQALPTPPGDYTVLKKIPVVDYKGPGYDYSGTKWNLRFKQQKQGNLYIHGAYWHHNFGHPMSHGCVNVSYDDMEPLYNWADVGTKITIQ